MLAKDSEAPRSKDVGVTACGVRCRCRRPYRRCPADSAPVAGCRAPASVLRCSDVPGEAERMVALEVAQAGVQSWAPIAVAQTVAPVADAQFAARVAGAQRAASRVVPAPLPAEEARGAASRSAPHFDERSRGMHCPVDSAELAELVPLAASPVRSAAARMVAAPLAWRAAPVTAASMAAQNADGPTRCGSLTDSE